MMWSGPRLATVSDVLWHVARGAIRVSVAGSATGLALSVIGPAWQAARVDPAITLRQE